MGIFANQRQSFVCCRVLKICIIISIVVGSIWSVTQNCHCLNVLLTRFSDRRKDRMTYKFKFTHTVVVS